MERTLPTRPQDRAATALILATGGVREAMMDNGTVMLFTGMSENLVIIERDGRMRSVIPASHPVRLLFLKQRHQSRAAAEQLAAMFGRAA